jgi:hypothetical protein
MGRKVLTDLGGGKMRTASGKMLKVGQRVQTPSGVKVVMADGSLQVYSAPAASSAPAKKSSPSAPTPATRAKAPTPATMSTAMRNSRGVSAASTREARRPGVAVTTASASTSSGGRGGRAPLPGAHNPKKR